MNSKYSTILVYTTLLFLGLFLFFWLTEEYQSEKLVIETEMQLNLIGDMVGLDNNAIKQIMMDAKSGKGATNIQMSVTLDDSLHKEQRTYYMNSSTDSSFIHKALSDKKDWLDIDQYKSTILKRSTNESDSSGFVTVSLDDDFLEKQADIPLIALKGIVPQIAFAILLFSLLCLGIYLLQKNYKDQQILLENKNNLISNITHELKTPVATIAVALEAIQDFNVKADKEKTNAYIQTSRQELRRLSDSIDQVLQLSKIDSKQEIYNFEATSLMDLSQEVVQNISIQADQKNITLSILPNLINTNIKVDPYHFKNMLFNILDNSIKYGKENGRITIHLEENKEHALVSIKDDGIGMDSKYHAKIFERFFRISNGNTHNVKGYGLGLSYVKEIIDAHQGSIQVLSKLNEGTNFIISIPKTNG